VTGINPGGILAGTGTGHFFEEIKMEGSATARSAQKMSTPPYLAHKTFINFVNGLKQGIPSRIDKSIMQSLSGATQGQLIATLHFFDLIDVDGKPKDLFSALVKSEGADRQRIFSEMVGRSYRFVFTDSLDLERATRKQLEERFAAQGIRGETLRKAFGLFLALAEDGGMRLSPHVKTPRPRIPLGIRRRTLATNQKKRIGDSQSNLAWSQLLLAKFPSFDPDWSEGVKTRWFESFEELMRRAI
jgi:Family of unknown function (DUF5343)